MIDLAIASHDGFHILLPHEAERLDLEPRSHGLLLVTEEDGSRWSLVASDLDQFSLIVAASTDPDLERVMLKAGQFRLRFGWPEPGVGFAVSSPTFERD